jgi:hypothetical protein
MTSFPCFAISPIIVLLTACAAQPQHDCPPGLKAMINDTLYFGTALPEGSAVSDEDWSNFIDAFVTPRFGQGLSFWQASGQWKSEDGPIVIESSYVLNLVHQESEITEAAVNEIMSAYKSEFSQEAVLRVRENSCVSI